MYNFYQPPKPCVVPEVNGINGANAYQLAPNSSVLLLDSNSAVVYLKQTDGGGYATTTAFDLVPHKDNTTRIYEDIDERLKRLEQTVNEQIANAKSAKQSNADAANAAGIAVVQNARNDTATVGGANGEGTRH